jgi:hypothetical protein
MAQDVAEELGLEYKMVRWQQDLSAASSAAGKLTSHLISSPHTSSGY